MGLGAAEVLAAIAKEIGLDVDLGALAARKVAAYLELAPTLAGFAATTELVGGLAGAGVPMAVASGSSRAAIDAALRKVGLDARIEVRVSVDVVAAGKPVPDVFLAAAEDGRRPREFDQLPRREHGRARPASSRLHC